MTRQPITTNAPPRTSSGAVLIPGTSIALEYDSAGRIARVDVQKGRGRGITPVEFSRPAERRTGGLG